MKAIFYPDIEFEKTAIHLMGKELFVERVYDDILTRNNMVILDIGANIGVITQHFIPFAKKIYSIEPSPREFEALKMNKEYNHWDNVELFQCAVTDKDGWADLSVSSTNGTTNTLALGERINANLFRSAFKKHVTINTVDTYLEKVPVRTTRLDTFMRNNNIEYVDFMKLDVEGAESEILMGEGFSNVADKIKAFEVEYHYPDWKETSKHVLDMGYTGRKYRTSANICLYVRS